jgi:L-lactate dehydrogenase
LLIRHLLRQPALPRSLAGHFYVEADQVEAQIRRNGVGILWSSARIAGVTIGVLVEQRGQNDGVHKRIEDTLRYADVTIIEGQ